jgi:valine--pyruvate aminotransferase
MRFSSFGEKFAARTGILGLMDDLGAAAACPEPCCNLGGGNPARIPQVEAAFVDRIGQIAADREACGALIGRYDGPQGRASFIEALAALLRREYGWDLGPRNIALTNGSQTAFFMLLNLFAGLHDSGRAKSVLFPLAPEYVGYADQSRFSCDLSARLPILEATSPRRFKYRVDFDALRVDEGVAAICASRPTNPSGNVLTDSEVERLRQEARRSGIPLIIDGAYGLPFPSIIFNEARASWDPDTVLCLSLSKIGLPNLRTGIVIASEEVIDALSAMNTVLSLCSGGFGPEVFLPFVATGEALRISREIVRPYYLSRSKETQAYLDLCLGQSGVDYSVHESEGAIFLWLWLKNLPIDSKALYERLKKRRVYVLPGEHFFFGEAANWDHGRQCLRLNYSQDWEQVRRGIEILAEEIALVLRG